MKQVWKFVTLGMLVIVLAACGGGRGAPGGNGGQPPSSDALLVEIKVNSSEAIVHESIELTAEVSGKDSASAVISWSTTAGSFFGPIDNSKVTWVAPAQAGSATITVEATVGTEAAAASVEITVKQPAQPLTVTMTGLPTESIVGEMLQLSADVAEGSTDTVFTWFADGTAIGTGDSLTWRTPPVPGETHEITVHAIQGGNAGSVTGNFGTVLCSHGNTADPNNPCELQNIVQVQAMKYDLAGHYTLGNDIDASETGNGGALWGTSGFSPIGESNNDPFSGTFFGNHHTISDLYISSTGSNKPLGLFGVLHADAKAGMVVLKDVRVERDLGEATGAFAGINRGLIAELEISGVISGANYTGGAVGSNHGVVGLLVVDVHVTSAGGGSQGTGGAIGRNHSSGGGLADSVVIATVEGTHSVGGAIGYSDNGILNNVHVMVDVTGDNQVGGLVGRATGITIKDSSASTNVTGKRAVGGLVGSIFNGSAISASSSSGSVDGGQAGFDVHMGGLVGGVTGTAPFLIVDSHSDADVTATGNMVGGLVGYMEQTGILGSRSEGQVITPDGYYVGGLVGYMATTGIIRDSSSLSLVEGLEAVGGLVGKSDGDADGTALIIQSFTSRGTTDDVSVTGQFSVGGLVGENHGKIIDSYSLMGVYSPSEVGRWVGWLSQANRRY